ncbi:hypothetical protein [Streptomyces atroolivaceus]|uniref:hypothetical protein n=1 Tax=Streptomyces atroolivaceus TaxID=66869 RepID=UPI002023DE69|nr:hypothetical protein [Streptomyces atroolivaceus]
MKLPVLRSMALLTAATALLTMPGTAPAGADGAWRKTGGDARGGVSGLAYEGPTGDGTGMNALVVHDNKRSGQQRLSRITHRTDSDVVSPVTWDGPEPVDLEAIEGLPGKPGEYLALTARGILYRLDVTGLEDPPCGRQGRVAHAGGSTAGHGRAGTRGVRCAYPG